MQKLKCILATMLTCVMIVCMVGSASGFANNKYYFENTVLVFNELKLGHSDKLAAKDRYPLALEWGEIKRGGYYEIGLYKGTGNAIEKIMFEQEQLLAGQAAGRDYVTKFLEYEDYYAPYLYGYCGIVVEVEKVIFRYNNP